MTFMGMGVVTLPNTGAISSYNGYPGPISCGVAVGGQQGSVYLTGTRSWWYGAPGDPIDDTPIAWFTQAARSWIAAARGPTLLDNALAAQIEVRVDQVSGVTPNYGGMTLGAWLPLYHSGTLGYVFGYSCSVTALHQEDYKSGSFQLSVRFAGSSVVLQSPAFNFAVDANSN